jgi:hypothetical protein
MNKSEVATYTLRIERELLDELHEIADREHRNVAQKLRLMIEQEIAHTRAGEEQEGGRTSQG